MIRFILTLVVSSLMATLATAQTQNQGPPQANVPLTIQLPPGSVVLPVTPPEPKPLPAVYATWTQDFKAKVVLLPTESFTLKDKTVVNAEIVVDAGFIPNAIENRKLRAGLPIAGDFLVKNSTDKPVAFDLDVKLQEGSEFPGSVKLLPKPAPVVMTTIGGTYLPPNVDPSLAEVKAELITLKANNSANPARVAALEAKLETLTTNFNTVVKALVETNAKLKETTDKLANLDNVVGQNYATKVEVKAVNDRVDIRQGEIIALQKEIAALKTTVATPQTIQYWDGCKTVTITIPGK